MGWSGAIALGLISVTSGVRADELKTNRIDLDPAVIERSPVLQRWLQDIPNVQHDIETDPSFRTRLRVGYLHFPSTDHVGGWQVGIEDGFVGNSRLTVSGDYAASWNGRREAWGADVRYYLRPLGKTFNLAPVVGYRQMTTQDQIISGPNLGLRLQWVPSRPSAADISVTQTWIAPGSDRETGVTTLTVGYAVTKQVRVISEIQQQNSPERKDSRVGIGAEWMF